MLQPTVAPLKAKAADRQESGAGRILWPERRLSVLAAPTALQLDPSRTTVLARQYARALQRDLDEIIRLTLLGIGPEEAGGNNALGLSELIGDPGPETFVKFDPVTGRSILDKPTTQVGFETWLGGTTEDILLVGRRDVPNPFVSRALAQGARQADIDLQRAGLIPRLRVADRPQVVGVRFQGTLKSLSDDNFARIQGMGMELNARAADRVAEGFARNWKPSTVSRALQKDLGLAKVQANAIARTELVRASAESRLDRFEAWGVTRVGAVIETRFTTAGDELVCVRCLGLEGRLFTIGEARGIIPVHT